MRCLCPLFLLAGHVSRSGEAVQNQDALSLSYPLIMCYCVSAAWPLHWWRADSHGGSTSCNNDDRSGGGADLAQVPGKVSEQRCMDHCSFQCFECLCVKSHMQVFSSSEPSISRFTIALQERRHASSQVGQCREPGAAEHPGTSTHGRCLPSRSCYSAWKLGFLLVLIETWTSCQRGYHKVRLQQCRHQPHRDLEGRSAVVLAGALYISACQPAEVEAAPPTAELEPLRGGYANRTRGFVRLRPSFAAPEFVRAATGRDKTLLK
jgi:hypothetical protein